MTQSPAPSQAPQRAETAHCGDAEPGASGFLECLETLAEQNYHHRHPFHALMHAGRLDRGDLRLWVKCRYHYQTRVAIVDALIAAKSESPAFGQPWRRRPHDRQGGGPRQPGWDDEAPGGLAPWRRLGNALGIGDSELESASEALPEVRAACDEYVEHVRAADLLRALAYTLTDHFAPRLLQLDIDAWRRHYPVVPAAALDAFAQDVTGAAGSARLAYVLEQASTAAQRESCLQAFQHQCQILWRLLDAVYLERRRACVPHIERRARLMRLSSLASPDAPDQQATRGVLMLAERALALTSTAYELLDCCEGQLTLGQIVAQLAHYHAVERETVERDVATFLAALEQRCLLAFEGEPGR